MSDPLAGDGRAQSHVVGVALLVAITAVSLGALTAGIGGVVQHNAAAADADRVADAFAGIEATEATGVRRHRVAFASGSLSVESRTVRVLSGGTVIDRREADALVFASGERRVAYLAGAVVRGRAGDARVTRPPPISASEGVLVVGLPVLNASGTDGVSGSGGTRVTLRTDVQHSRQNLGRGSYGLAVETATPEAWARRFRREGATVSRRDFDDDGVVSVVATFPGRRRAYLVVHDVGLEVGA